MMKHRATKLLLSVVALPLAACVSEFVDG